MYMSSNVLFLLSIDNMYARVLYKSTMKLRALINLFLFIDDIYFYDLTCTNFTLHRQYIWVKVKAIEDRATMEINETLLMFWSWNFFLRPATAWPNEDLKL